MESSYFPKPEFQQALAPFVLVQINTEGNAKEKSRRDRYLGTSYALPTYAILEADGTLVAKTGWRGGLDPGAALLTFLREHAR